MYSKNKMLNFIMHFKGKNEKETENRTSVPFSEEIETLRKENDQLKRLLNREIQTTYHLCVRYLRLKHAKDHITNRYYQLEKEYNDLVKKVKEFQHEIDNTVNGQGCSMRAISPTNLKKINLAHLEEQNSQKSVMPEKFDSKSKTSNMLESITETVNFDYNIDVKASELEIDIKQLPVNSHGKNPHKSKIHKSNSKTRSLQSTLRKYKYNNDRNYIEGEKYQHRNAGPLGDVRDQQMLIKTGTFKEINSTSQFPNIQNINNLHKVLHPGVLETNSYDSMQREQYKVYSGTHKHRSRKSRSSKMKDVETYIREQNFCEKKTVQIQNDCELQSRSITSKMNDIESYIQGQNFCEKKAVHAQNDKDLQTKGIPSKTKNIESYIKDQNICERKIIQTRNEKDSQSMCPLLFQKENGLPRNKQKEFEACIQNHNFYQYCLGAGVEKQNCKNNVRSGKTSQFLTEFSDSSSTIQTNDLKTFVKNYDLCESKFKGKLANDKDNTCQSNKCYCNTSCGKSSESTSTILTKDIEAFVHKYNMCKHLLKDSLTREELKKYINYLKYQLEIPLEQLSENIFHQTKNRGNILNRHENIENKVKNPIDKCEIQTERFSYYAPPSPKTHEETFEIIHTQSAPNIVQNLEFLNTTSVKRSISQISVRDMYTNT